MRSGTESKALEEMERRLLYLAQRTYRIPRDAAADLAQSARLTFLEVEHRYPKVEEHPRIVVGIFRNKCREHIERSVRATRGLKALKASAEAGTADLPAVRARRRAEGGLVGDLIRKEEGQRILEALAALRPPAREMFRLITEENLTRRQLIERLGLLPATLDSRLHAYRKELQLALDGKGARAGNGSAKARPGRAP